MSRDLPNTRSTAPAPPDTRGPRRSRKPFAPARMVAIVLLMAAVAAACGSSDGASGAADVAAIVDASKVTITGDPLPAYQDGATSDAALGMAFPTFEGTGLSAEPVKIDVSGEPTIVLFVAHWCPHCQREVPLLVDWMVDGKLNGVRVQTIATANDPNKPNYPPSSWLKEEEWPTPVLVDTDGVASVAAGLTVFPYFVATDAEGKVVARVSGELAEDQVAQLTDLAKGVGS